MAVLIGIMVPAMTRYIEKAKIASANYNARIVYDYVTDYLTESGLDWSVFMADDGIISGNDGKYYYRLPMTKYNGSEIEYNGAIVDIENYFKMLMGTNNDSINKAPVIMLCFNGSGKLEYVSWASKMKSKIVGSYPALAVARATTTYKDAGIKISLYNYIPNTGDQ